MNNAGINIVSLLLILMASWPLHHTPIKSNHTQAGVPEKTWIQSSGPYGGIITSLALATDSAGGKFVYAGTEYGGVYCSTDGGRRWASHNDGLASINILALVAATDVDETSNTLVFASTDAGVFSLRGRETHWIRASIGPMAFSADRVLAVPGASGGTMFFGMTLDGIFRSENSNGSWKRVDTGFGHYISLQSIAYAYAKDDRTHRVILVATDQDGVLRSTDEGMTWVRANEGLPDHSVSSIVALGGKLFAGTSHTGIFTSDNNGDRWIPLKNGFPNLNVQALAVSPAINGTNPAVIVSGTDGGGIFTSRDNGASWRQSNTGMTSKFVRALLVVDLGGGVTKIFAATASGIFVSTDDADHWTYFNDGIKNTSVDAFAVGKDQSTKGGCTLYAGSRSGVFVSTDEGSIWTPINDGLTDQYVGAVLTSQSGIYAGTSHGVFFRNYRDESWSLVGLTDKYISSFEVDSSCILAGAWEGIYSSTDGGKTWLSRLNKFVWSMASTKDSVGESRFFAGTGDGVFVSTDQGATWSLTSKRGEVSAVGAKGSCVLAASRGRDVFLSTDYGASWRPTGLKKVMVLSFAFGDSVIFAGTLGDGVFVSTDGGTTWSHFNTGLLTKLVESLAIYDSQLFLGSRYSGVWRYPM